MRKTVYAEDYPEEVLAKMQKNAYDEETSFRTQMKGLEEYATSGAVTKPGANIAGMRARVAHRMGDRFDVQVRDPFTKQMRTVVSHQYDLRGRRTGTDVAWTPGDPRSVAAVFGIPFVSAFGDLPPTKPQEVKDEESVKRSRHDVFQKAAEKRAAEEAQMELEMQAYLRVKGKKRHEVAPSDWALYEAYMKRRGAK